MSSRINQLCQQNEGDTGRSYVKCDCCRQRHKKCLPASRIWPEERCTECKESNLLCGPPLHYKDSPLSGPEGRSSKRAKSQSGLSLSDRNDKNNNNQDYGGLGPSEAAPNFGNGSGPRPHLPPISSSQRSPLSPPTTTLLSVSSGSTPKRKLCNTESLLDDPGETTSCDPTQDVLGSRLIDLGYLFILYEHLKGLELASKPPLSTEYGHSITNNIKILAVCTAYRVQHALEAIIDLIEVDGRSTESRNLRYREALDTVEDINKLGPRVKILVDLEVTILTKLILIYEQQKDAPAVRRFSRRRAKLHHGSTIVPNASHIEHTAQSWVETYKKLPALFDRLSLPAEAPLYAIDPSAFPAQHSALRCGDDDVAKFLCKSDGALQHLDMLKQNFVLAAAAVGKLPLLETLVQNDKSLLQSRDLFHRTPLFHTAYQGDLKTFESLVQAGADVFARDEASQSILGAASAAGNLDIVRWLLELGGVTSPNDHYLGSRSPLHDAARAGHKDVCSLLLRKGADANYIIDNVTPAQAARVNGFDDVANMLKLYEAHHAGQHVSNPSIGNLPPQALADGILPLGVCQPGQSACPSPSPPEVTYTEAALEETFISEFLTDFTPIEYSEAGTDGPPLDGSGFVL
ncbi:hypothetical protein EPUS_00505 [Endocarpon pusillum Z07020]|uniref:Uncharacterized protein n=1 Tax=Endocarpon pusillum (strain Z07020 / HMAS-L-300199) TaxID=1263415 RepID=U1GI80_ENDPU|nr:uncharacterized protein EPUS_00505 [Endocarpon pusillum Z07020]ERF71516.1 hypothetical protein EPUS_00505 [Endocarpon pusillum Z07020]